jgi:hypothetical protein
MKEGMVIIIGGSGHMEEKSDMSMGGEEMNVYGYETQNFHICPGAKESFEQLVKAGYRGEEMEKVINMAMLVDDYLGMEIHIVNHGADPESMRAMIDKGNAAMFYAGCLAEKVGDEYMIRLFDFMPDHLLVAMGMKNNEFNDMTSMEEGSC